MWGVTDPVTEFPSSMILTVAFDRWRDVEAVWLPSPHATIRIEKRSEAVRFARWMHRMLGAYLAVKGK